MPVCGSAGSEPPSSRLRSRGSSSSACGRTACSTSPGRAAPRSGRRPRSPRTRPPRPESRRAADTGSPMQVPATIFREYDIRGTVGDQLTGDVAHAIGKAFATLAAERLGRTPRIAVGRDNRPSGADFAANVLSGIEDAGAFALSVGMVPTPALYFATHTLSVDGGLQVTGSHNPPAFNGFKMVLEGGAIHGEDIKLLHRMILEDRTPDRAGGSQKTHGDVLDGYRKAIVARNGPLPRRVKVVVDCGNGVASLVAVETLRTLGADVVPLFCESDGTFPNHHPDPTVPENLQDLQAAVRREKAELGIAFDGDGDRIGAVDEQGRILFGAARLLRYLAELGGPLSRLLADLPPTVSTPELRVDCADERKFTIVERAARHFATRYSVSTLDGVRITFPDGWGLVRASNTQPVLVLRFEAGSAAALAAYRAEVEDWLAAQGIRA